MAQKIKAGAHYGDWEGNASADDAGRGNVREWLVSQGKFDREKDFLVAIEFAALEQGMASGQPYIRALIAEAAGFEDFRVKLAQAKSPMKLRSVDITVGVIDFLKMFKDFSVTLRAGNLDISAYEFDFEN
jgi:hypothetical protein